MRISCAVPRERQNHRGQRQVLDQVPGLGEAPVGELVFGGEQSADIGAEEAERQVHDHEREQEIRHREADEADQREEVVADRVLAHRRVDADRQRQPPGDDQRRERDQHGEPEAVADHLGDRPVPLHRHAEIAGEHAHHPLGILHVERLSEPVEFAQRHASAAETEAARLAESLRDIGGDEVAGRKPG